MSESNQAVSARKSSEQSHYSKSGKRTKMLVGSYIIEQSDEKGNVEPIAITIPDEMF